jgi:nitrite reductase/ring-hydroxylating ferredoxin subunit
MRFIFCILLFIVCTTCGCRKSRNQIPNTPIDLYIDTKLPSYISLNIVGGWIYASSGYKGLIIYRRSQDAFNAYERACPYDPTDDCSLVEVLKDNVTAVDSCCGSQYLITDGNVIKGPATQTLLQYQTTFDGTILHVFN